jgi:hypothetical protein
MQRGRLAMGNFQFAPYQNGCCGCLVAKDDFWRSHTVEEFNKAYKDYPACTLEDKPITDKWKIISGDLKYHPTALTNYNGKYSTGEGRLTTETGGQIVWLKETKAPCRILWHVSGIPTDKHQNYRIYYGCNSKGEGGAYGNWNLQAGQTWTNYYTQFDADGNELKHDNGYTLNQNMSSLKREQFNLNGGNQYDSDGNGLSPIKDLQLQLELYYDDDGQLMLQGINGSYPMTPYPIDEPENFYVSLWTDGPCTTTADTYYPAYNNYDNSYSASFIVFGVDTDINKPNCLDHICDCANSLHDQEATCFSLKIEGMHATKDVKVDTGEIDQKVSGCCDRTKYLYYGGNCSWGAGYGNYGMYRLDCAANGLTIYKENGTYYARIDFSRIVEYTVAGWHYTTVFSYTADLGEEKPDCTTLSIGPEEWELTYCVDPNLYDTSDIGSTFNWQKLGWTPASCQLTLEPSEGGSLYITAPCCSTCGTDGKNWCDNLVVQLEGYSALCCTYDGVSDYGRRNTWTYKGSGGSATVALSATGGCLPSTGTDTTREGLIDTTNPTPVDPNAPVSSGCCLRVSCSYPNDKTSVWMATANLDTAPDCTTLNKTLGGKKYLYYGQYQTAGSSTDCSIRVYCSGD